MSIQFNPLHHWPSLHHNHIPGRCFSELLLISLITWQWQHNEFCVVWIKLPKKRSPVSSCIQYGYTLPVNLLYYYRHSKPKMTGIVLHKLWVIDIELHWFISGKDKYEIKRTGYLFMNLTKEGNLTPTMASPCYDHNSFPWWTSSGSMSRAIILQGVSTLS